MGYEKWFDESKEEQRMICGMTYFQICLYFLIYSFGGWVVEVIFHAVALGKVINRGFLNGPVCPVYGFGVLSVFALLNTIQGSGRQMSDGMIFVFGIVLATAVELVAGWLLDVCFHARWWDYSDKILNINGRVCLLYSIFWGILTVFLVRKVNPCIDKICNKIQEKIPKKILKIIISILIVFLAFDCIATVFAQEYFIDSMIIRNGVQVEKQEKVQEMYNKIRENPSISNFVDTFWNDEKMIKTFPNIKIKDKDGNIIWLRELLPSIKPYYWRR